VSGLAKAMSRGLASWRSPRCVLERLEEALDELGLALTNHEADYTKATSRLGIDPATRTAGPTRPLVEPDRRNIRGRRSG
jgi:hypothetical protein